MGISMSQWRSAYASVQGTSHVESNQPCQDACTYEQFLTSEGKEFLVMIASDGSGSALLSHVGSQMVCQFLLEKIYQFFKEGWTLNQITERHARFLLRYVSISIGRVARLRKIKKRDFAATLLVALISDEYSAFFQLGDGAIVIDSDSGYRPVFWPQSGKYANETYFITDESATENLKFMLLKETVNKIALFTDGIQRLALKYDIKAAYSPFFHPLFEYLQSVPEETLPQLNEQIENFLNSEAVNARTNDDKTLMLACRIAKFALKSEGSTEIKA
jgi:serine/threonine protein phosphatase PrpC